MEYKIKQQRLVLESEKLEIMSKMQKIEADKLLLEKNLKSYENSLNYSQSLYTIQTDAKLADILRQKQLEKEDHNNELLKVRNEADKAIHDLKLLYEKELNWHKEQEGILQNKIKKYLEEIEVLKENNEALSKFELEDVKSQLEYYKSLCYRKGFDEDCQSLFTDSIGSKDSFNRNSRSFKSGLDTDHETVVFKDFNFDLLNKFKKDNERLQGEIKKIQDETENNENKLKNEIKFLIGKLLKAKSKLTAEGELTASLRKENMVCSMRNSSIQKSFAVPSGLSKRNSGQFMYNDKKY